MGGFHLENADNGNQNEEHDGLGLSNALGFQGIGVDDVQSQHFGGVDGTVVGAAIGHPPTWRSNAFSVEVVSQTNGHGRAMFAPTRVFLTA